MTKQKKILFGIILFTVFLIVDRFVWMPNRAKHLWLQKSGRNLGDPIAYNQYFVLQGSEIIFRGLKAQTNIRQLWKIERVNFILLVVILGTYTFMI